MGLGKQRRKPATRRLFAEQLEVRRVLNADLPAPEVLDVEPAVLRFDSVDALREYLLDAAVDRWYGDGDPPASAPAPDAHGLALPRLEQLATAALARLDAATAAPAITDGSYLYLLERGHLTIVDIRDPAQPQITASVAAGVQGQMFLEGDRLAVVGRSVAHEPRALRPAARGFTQVDLWDVQDRSVPVLLHSTTAAGALLDAELDDSQLVMALHSGIDLPHPRLQCEQPDEGQEEAPGAAEAEGQLPLRERLRNVLDTFIDLPNVVPHPCTLESEAAYVDRVGTLIVEHVLPSFVARDSEGQVLAEGLLVEPTEVVAVLGAPVRGQTSIVKLDLATGDETSELLVGAGILGRGARTARIAEPSVLIAGPARTADGQASTEVVRVLLDDLAQIAVGSVGGRPVLHQPFAEIDGQVHVITTDGEQLDGFALEVVNDRLTTLVSFEDFTAAGPVAMAHFSDSWGITGPLGTGDPLQLLNAQAPTPSLAGQVHAHGWTGFATAVAPHHLLTLGHATSLDELPMLLRFVLHDVSDLSQPEAVGQYTLTSCQDAEPVLPAGVPRYLAEAGMVVMPTLTLPLEQLLSDPARLRRLLELPEVAELAGQLKARLGIELGPAHLFELLRRCRPADDPTTAGEAEGTRLESALLDRLTDHLRNWFAPQLTVLRVDAAAPDHTISLAGTVPLQGRLRAALTAGGHLYVLSGRRLSVHPLDNLSETSGQLALGSWTRDDRFRLAIEDREVVLDVLANDDAPRELVRIVEAYGGRGSVRISDDGAQLIYSPPAEGLFVTRDALVYRVQHEDGRTDHAMLEIELSHSEATQRLQDLAIADLAERLQVARESIQTLLVEEMIWPDSCLGIHDLHACLHVVTPGFRIVLQSGDEEFVYHTDAVETVRLVEFAEIPRLVPDHFQVRAGSHDNVLSVLDNDFPGLVFIRQPQITAVTQPAAGGHVHLIDGQLRFDPEPGFLGEVSFTYTVDSSLSTHVTVEVADIRPMVDVQVEVTDAEGRPLTSIGVGDAFYLEVYVQDLREDPHGVFAAFVDVTFDSSMVSVAGEPQFGDAFRNGRSSDVDEQGMIDETGAFAGLDELGGGRFLLARFPMLASDMGQVTFDAHPADQVPERATAVYRLDRILEVPEVRFGGTLLEIVNSFHNAELPTDVDGDGETTAGDALAVVNRINATGTGSIATMARTLFSAEGETPQRRFYDVNGDRQLTSGDVLWIVNVLNKAAAARKAPAIATASGPAAEAEAGLDAAVQISAVPVASLSQDHWYDAGLDEVVSLLAGEQAQAQDAEDLLDYVNSRLAP